MKRYQSTFIFSVAVILFISGAAKLLSAFGSAEALNRPDALLLLSHRKVFVILALIELALSAYLLTGSRSSLQLGLVVWLSTNFLLYRIGLWYMGAPNLCNCLGNMDAYLPLSPRTINLAAFIALGWMFVGSVGLVVCKWREKPAASMAQVEKTGVAYGN